MNILYKLSHKEVFGFFEELTAIPRTSGNEQQVSDYLVNFAKERGLEVFQDKALNVIIKKNGTKGYEKLEPVIIQGHMDMVGEKTSTSTHDFSKDPLKLRIVDDFIYATDTTLGGDNGIAVAYGLAILDAKKLKHPPLELLITTDEETGMFGAAALSAENLSGKTLLNIDTEEEGIFIVSCAGGLTSTVTFSPKYQDLSGIVMEVSVTDLQGGHSGMEIIKQRGNAIKLLGRVLNRLNVEVEIKLVTMKGGAKHNAISREAYATIAFPEENKVQVSEIIKEMDTIFKAENRVEDPKIKVSIKKASGDQMMTTNSSKKIIGYMMTVPDGIQRMSSDIKGLVESSLNLGVLEDIAGKIVFTHAVRSSRKSKKAEITQTLATLAGLTGGVVNNTGDYPEWQYEEDSKIRKIAIETYKGLYKKEPEISAIHAGLECGLLKKLLQGTDMISFGPNLFDVHTPGEHMSISSIERTYTFLTTLLENLK
ncbi:MAG: aminoacyl-histidine dipeptidase [Firmicutes bacterium HGW-Firmicutes-1]|jgi:dipeptidase D|nr:MAG: aminoacyl-histidine dipeptidase [Firmicutes bacterium HGW-Firmicutes-1]